MSSHEQPVLLLNDDCAIQIDVSPPDARPRTALDDSFHRDRRNTLPAAGVAKSASPGVSLAAIAESSFGRVAVRSTSCPSLEQHSCPTGSSEGMSPLPGLLSPTAGFLGPSLLSLAASPMGSTLSIDARCNDLDAELDAALSSDSMDDSEAGEDADDSQPGPALVRNMRDVPAKLLRQMFAQRTRESMEREPGDSKCVHWLQSIDET